LSPSGGGFCGLQKWRGRFSCLIFGKHFRIAGDGPVIRVNDGFEEAHENYGQALKSLAVPTKTLFVT
jgi:hypothetical protein